MSGLKKNIRDMKVSLARLLEFPSESAGIPAVEIKGRCEAYVFGCKRIAEYDLDRIIFESDELNIIINGKDLLIEEFTRGGVCVHGTINDVRFGGET